LRDRLWAIRWRPPLLPRRRLHPRPPLHPRPRLVPPRRGVRRRIVLPQRRVRRRPMGRPRRAVPGIAIRGIRRRARQSWRVRLARWFHPLPGRDSKSRKGI